MLAVCSKLFQRFRPNSLSQYWINDKIAKYRSRWGLRCTLSSALWRDWLWEHHRCKRRLWLHHSCILGHIYRRPGTSCRRRTNGGNGQRAIRRCYLSIPGFSPYGRRHIVVSGHSQISNVLVDLIEHCERMLMGKQNCEQAELYMSRL